MLGSLTQHQCITNITTINVTSLTQVMNVMFHPICHESSLEATVFAFVMFLGYYCLIVVWEVLSRKMVEAQEKEGTG